ncbi:hypothetical protein [Paraglaciecola sp.]|uniref:hypothetical protein n=1 Tax=Paraglaciecola sp. TaxID=1920173 RepID=UPI003EF5E277
MILLLTGLTHAKEPVVIGAYPTPGLIQEDGNGLFNKLNRLIFTQIDQPIELSIKPLKRIKKEFNDGEVSAYFPELWEKLPGEKTDYVVSDPIFYKKVILFTRKSSDYHQLADLKDKTLGLVSGFSYSKDIINDPRFTLSYQRDDETNIRLLANNRIEGVLGGFPATVLAIQKSQYKHLIQYDVKKPVAILESFYVCPNNQAGKQLCANISKGLKKLQASGILTLNSKTGYSKLLL